MKHGVAIIGCGDMGKTHATAWAERKDCKILTVHDPDKTRADELAGKTGGKSCATCQEAITQEGVTIVSVCAPVFLHKEISCFAAAAGRHVLCEKPIALTLEDADEMIKTAKDSKVKLAVSYQLRGSSRYQRYKEFVQNGDFGGPVVYRFVDIREIRSKIAMHSKSMNGGSVIDMAGHWFDLMRFFTGSEPKSVFASGYIFAEGKKCVESVKDLAIDTAEIQVTMTNGHTLSAFVDWGMPKGFQCIREERLVGPSMAVWTENGKVVARYAGRTVVYDAQTDPCGPVVRIADLIDAIEHDCKPEVAGEEGKAALAVSLAVLKSIENGKAVDL